MINLNNIIGKLSCNRVFKYFKEISNIPRASGNEKAISDYLFNFAKEHQLEVKQDKALNIVIKKQATRGYENAPSVILQGHMDMVCEKNKDVEHDFSKDPIKFIVEGDYITARGTTLGADDGIAIAYFLAILENNDLQHPLLEVLITTQEENGMGGVSKVSKEDLSGEILINVDSEEEGKLLVSCAGGIRNIVRLTVEVEDRKEGFKPYKIFVHGLKGGHSGMDIKKGRGNSNKLMGRILNYISNKMELFIADINGGLKSNAIPRESEAIVFVKESNKQKLKDVINYCNEVFKKELNISDSDVTVNLESGEEKSYRIFSKALTNKIITVLMLMPQGVQSMSQNIKGLVESSINLGVVKTKEDEVTFESAIRSSVKTLKENTVNQIEVLCDSIDAAMTVYADYPAWEYKEKSYIRDLFISVYEDLYNEKPEITAVHAGIECGILKEILGDIDMISFGPNMYDVHTPNERVSISSVERNYDYLIEVLKRIK
ncbi:aminoacyl-histidine dipeptidase [Clostridium botulinum]|uniref:aminoacyl-histidine dipeptidase n=1 Tax=Clostridium botulinum TaxID=1491 RepID=UPI00052DF95D|nr:aminoacyl-histidine dipeptidase [Clostridium botulinum]KGM94837.1 aminoacyl-histidine dipeptidase [Clostridium botulinum D str. CCUG 7971]KOC45913.1 aminoacyl-histidine dipeptidase [Clostridium botulinum]NFO99076.1 aminoacyl-histidine dipeptidase [Clostridium botulinum]OOV50671.1 aminoacyl-histidine dipeptidase [Clostridium botulinum D/C]OOV53440.1 aminoacyl-histidine dipeptidase [Clostridium botulinum D/C]